MLRGPWLTWDPSPVSRDPRRAPKKPERKNGRAFTRVLKNVKNDSIHGISQWCWIFDISYRTFPCYQTETFRTCNISTEKSQGFSRIMTRSEGRGRQMSKSRESSRVGPGGTRNLTGGVGSGRIRRLSNRTGRVGTP